ncbi:MAG TPA: hypothetical protein VHH88_03765 [Verrucomicrobiae bacterium]|nr:hypothetical protein [Verrucomicrobiae bacterium]
MKKFVTLTFLLLFAVGCDNSGGRGGSIDTPGGSGSGSIPAPGSPTGRQGYNKNAGYSNGVATNSNSGVTNPTPNSPGQAAKP